MSHKEDIINAINEAFEAYVCSDMWKEETEISEMSSSAEEAIFSFAMQTLKQDHDVFMENLRIKNKNFQSASDKQLDFIRRLMKDKEISMLEYMKEKWGVEKIPHLSLAQASELIDNFGPKKQGEK